MKCLYKTWTLKLNVVPYKYNKHHLLWWDGLKKLKFPESACFTWQDWIPKKCLCKNWNKENDQQDLRGSQNQPCADFFLYVEWNICGGKGSLCHLNHLAHCVLFRLILLRFLWGKRKINKVDENFIHTYMLWGNDWCWTLTWWNHEHFTVSDIY